MPIAGTGINLVTKNLLSSSMTLVIETLNILFKLRHTDRRVEGNLYCFCVFLFASCKYMRKKIDRSMRFSLQWRFMSMLWYRAPSLMGTDASEKRACLQDV